MSTDERRALLRRTSASAEPSPPPGARLRANRLPLRDCQRLRRVSRPPAPSSPHRRVAAAHGRPRLRRARGGRRSRPRRTLPRVARPLCRPVLRRAKRLPEQAQYCVALAFRIRYVMQMNAREAMHLIELRSGPQGHPSYRRIAQEMARLIREEAGHDGHRRRDDLRGFLGHRPRAARSRARRRTESPESLEIATFIHSLGGKSARTGEIALQCLRYRRGTYGK